MSILIKIPAKLFKIYCKSNLKGDTIHIVLLWGYYSCIIACFSDVGLPSLFVAALSNISCFCQVECTFSNISTC